ncbi:MAG TPA: LysE family transporter [Anaerolineales bacterium]
MHTDISFLLQGLILGLSIAAPVGPIGVLCIRRTLTEGRIAGFVSGLGAATADAFYGAIAGFGLTFISSFLIDQQLWLRLTGGFFLLYLGIKTFRSSPPDNAALQDRSGIFGAYASTLVFTLTNPLTILSFAAIYAGLGLTATGRNYVSAALLVLGVFAGSAAWWLLLSGGISLFRKRFGIEALRWTNKVSGLAITIFGLIVLRGLM